MRCSSPERLNHRRKNPPPLEVDHSKLCPFCDELLPDSLSPAFYGLLRTASNRAVKKPRSTNRHGLKASLPVYIGACERHRFEAKLLPQARKAGWPDKINFNEIPARLIARTADLTRILDVPMSSSFFCDAIDHIAQVGIRVAESAMGQFATFDRILPG